jgi:hypothetical protein
MNSASSGILDKMDSRIVGQSIATVLLSFNVRKFKDSRCFAPEIGTPGLTIQILFLDMGFHLKVVSLLNYFVLERHDIIRSSSEEQHRSSSELTVNKT